MKVGSSLFVGFALALLASAPSAQATSLFSSCASNFSSCSIYEDGLTITLPGIGVAGDVVLTDSGGAASDVFRIFNDIVNTGGGTGLGGTAFFYSEDLGNLPDPSTYSNNVVVITETFGPVGTLVETDRTANGTAFSFFSNGDAPVPEPSTLTLIALGAAAIVWRRRRV